MGTTALTVERYAEMRAQMEAGRLRDEVLARAGLTADEWTAAQREWLERMGAELERGCFELTNRYTQAFLEHLRAFVAASPPVRAPSGRAPSAPRLAAPAPRLAAPAAPAALATPAGTAPLPDMAALVAALPFTPASGKRPFPTPTPSAAAHTAPALSLEQYAALCAELSLHPRSASAIYPRYGLRDAAAWHATDAAWQARMRSDAALEARWQQLIAHYRAHYRAR